MEFMNWPSRKSISSSRTESLEMFGAINGDKLFNIGSEDEMNRAMAPAAAEERPTPGSIAMRRRKNPPKVRRRRDLRMCERDLRVMVFCAVNSRMRTLISMTRKRRGRTRKDERKMSINPMTSIFIPRFLNPFLRARGQARERGEVRGEPVVQKDRKPLELYSVLKIRSEVSLPPSVGSFHQNNQGVKLRQCVGRMILAPLATLPHSPPPRVIPRDR
jgi:hypothetical protein